MFFVRCTLLATPPTSSPIPSPRPTPTPALDSVAGFYLWQEQLESAPLADRPYLVNNYLAQLTTTPLTDDKTAIFLWEGFARSVQLIGDMTGWHDTLAQPFTQIKGTNLWWLSAEYEPNARLEYQLLIDGEQQLDRRNKKTRRTGYGINSEFAMPQYQPSADTIPDGKNYPRGKISEHTIESNYLGQTRTIFVYQPASQLVGASYPSVYIHDGTEYMQLINMPAILDQLIGSRAIPPLVAVFIPPIDRRTEYAKNDAYADFVAKEVVPFVQKEYATDTDPSRTATMGASLGGLISLHLAMQHPEKFGLVASQSGAFSFPDDTIIDKLVQSDLKLRIDLIIGSYETAVVETTPRGNLLEVNRRLNAKLDGTTIEHNYHEYPEGHSWGLWEAHIGDALRYLFH